jgi:TRAP-type C4-dicarboxylate transport system permease small subunit
MVIATHSTKEESTRQVQNWASLTADKMENALIFVAGSAFVIIAGLIVIQVFFRYVLRAPPIWTEELTRYVFVWLAWLSAAVVFRRGQHITIDAITSIMPDRLQAFHEFFVRVICVAILIFLLTYGWQALEFATSYSPALNIQMVYVYASAPVAALIMLSFVVLDTVDKYLARRSSRAV